MNPGLKRLTRYAASLPLTTPSLLTGAPQHLLLLSHMRSCSSLLSHLLGSHAEIEGHSERHISYRSRLDLLRLRGLLAEEGSDVKGAKFALDKLLHDELVVAPRVLAAPDVRLLFLVRTPEASLPSLVRLGTSDPGTSWCRDPDQATRYYVERLSRLAALATGTPDERRPIFIRAEQLLGEPETVLGFLTEELGLTQPLSEEYTIFDDTGTMGRGDPSDRIRRGHVIRSTTASAEAEPAEVPISQDLLRDAVQAYERCCATLARRCATCG